MVGCSNPECQTSAGCKCYKNPNKVYKPYAIPYYEPYTYPQPPYYSQTHTNASTNKGWECPKCGRVYAPCVTECVSCNSVCKSNFGQATSIGK